MVCAVRTRNIKRANREEIKRNGNVRRAIRKGRKRNGSVSRVKEKIEGK
jgi:hypothetical protein